MVRFRKRIGCTNAAASSHHEGRRFLNSKREVIPLEWSQTHYNLIVYGRTDTPMFRSPLGLDTFRSERLFGYTDGDVRAIYQEDLDGLSGMLALVVAELQPGNATPPAFVSRIEYIEKRRRDVRFRFERLLGGFTSEEVFSCGYFDIDVSGGVDERSHTHWAVKKGNLVEGVLRLLNNQPTEQCPKAFNIEPWPLGPLGHVAVMMPFASAFDPIYEAVRSACGRLRLDTLRVDDIYGPTHIIDDVFKTIEQSRLVISDLTGRNANVLYETGLAHARNRDVVMIVQNEDDVPFDLRHIRHVRYLPNQQGLEKLVSDLEETIRAVGGQ